MATIQINATAQLTANSGSGNGTITWTSPTLPDGAVINSITLSGTWTWTGQGNITGVNIGGTSTYNATAFTISLGNSVALPIAISCKGNKKASGNNFNWNNLIATYTYTVPGESSGIYVKVGAEYREAQKAWVKRGRLYVELTKEEMQSLTGNYRVQA